MFENGNARKLCASKIWTYTVDLMVVVTIVSSQLDLLGRQAMVELGLTHLTGHFIRHIKRPNKLSLCRTADHRLASWFIAEDLQTVLPGVSRFI